MWAEVSWTQVSVQQPDIYILFLKYMLYNYPANYVLVLQFICFVEVTRQKFFRHTYYISFFI